MDVWILTWHPHYTAATIVPPEMIYGLALLRNGQIIAFVPACPPATTGGYCT